MSNKAPYNVSEKDLDNLLNQAFLNLDFNQPKNEQLMEAISHQVLHTNLVSTGIINKSLFIKLLGVIAIVMTSTLIYFSFFKQKTDSQSVQQSIILKEIKAPEVSVKKTTPPSDPFITRQEQKNKEAETPMNIVQSEEKMVPSLPDLPKNKETNAVAFKDEPKQKLEDTSFVFPKLSEKEIKATEKQKEKMTNWLLKRSKTKYALIVPKAGHSIMTGIDDTAAQFFIQNSEVTNLEYRTFLFDLIIHHEKETFLKAKPYQNLWLSAPGHAKGNMMKDLYFSDKTYNDYPVVNITPEGAELYCKWLSSLTQPNNDKIIARLPYENEWITAAKVKDASAIYPWPGDSIQNKLGCFLANFCITKQRDKLRLNHHIKCSAKNPNAYASAEYMLGDSMMPASVYAYNPNDNGVYCMVGNVAEMAYSNQTKSVVTKGGSWNSDFEQCKLYNQEELNGPIKANPMTGFRPIFRISQTHSFGSTQRENHETGIATLTAEETATALKDKKKMIDALIKLNKDKYAYIPMGSFIYKKDTFSVQSFYMETTEVTNLEYRTFLADLLIQNRTADYLIAKPNQQMWVTKFPYSYNEPMANLYFWHPAYDEYPVVNISRAGAQMYCNWLTIETNKVLKETNKPLINDLRIPADLEWAYAASNGKNQVKYANGNTFLRDSKGKYQENYMCYSKELCRYDSVMRLYVPKKGVKADNGETPSLISDGLFHTGSARSYTPNSYGLYCMAGNVSEMVNTFDKTSKKYLNTGTKGGSWFSCDYFLEIDADDEYPNEINASPLIGFRPVMTFSRTK